MHCDDKSTLLDIVKLYRFYTKNRGLNEILIYAFDNCLNQLNFHHFSSKSIYTITHSC
jgi:hypothetical protein